MPKTRCYFCFLLMMFCGLLLAATASHAQSQPTPASSSGGPVHSGIPAQMLRPRHESLPPQLLEELTAIKSAALVDDYAYHQLAHLTENIGPRPTGSLQAEAAVDYVAAELRQLGLGPARQIRDEFGFAVLRQESECPDRFPRRTGMPSKRPLF